MSDAMRKRAELADFLKTRRSRLHPEQYAAWIRHCSAGKPISAASPAASRKWPMTCSLSLSPRHF